MITCALAPAEPRGVPRPPPPRPRRLRTRVGLLPLALALALFAAHTASAQDATGTVEGSVRDRVGRPVAGTRVSVDGTSLETTSGSDGFYRLTFVPVGEHALHFERPGAGAPDVRIAWVSAGEALRLDLDPSQQDEERDRSPPIPYPASFGSSVVGHDIDRLPVSDPLEVLRLTAGVNAGRQDALVLRGSRPGEATQFVDGVPVRSMDTGESPLGLAPNMLTQATSRPGILGAAWGDAQAGALSFVTRSGGAAWHGSLAYESDALQGTTNRSGFQWIEGSVGGRPLEHLTVFAGGAATTRQAAELNAGIEGLPVYTFGPTDTTVLVPISGTPDSAAVVIPQIVQFGGSCDSLLLEADRCLGRRRPRAWESDSRWNAKARYDLGNGSALTFSALTQARQAIDWTTTMHEEGRPGSRATASVLALDWVQRIRQRPNNVLTVHATVSHQTNRANQGAVLSGADLDAESPSIGRAFDPLDFVVGFDQFAPGDPAAHLQRDSADGGWTLTRLRSDDDWDAAIENVRFNRGTRRPYLGRTDLTPTSTPRLNAYGVLAEHPRTGLDFGQTLRSERREFARVAIDWQTRRHRLTAGLEGTWGRVGHWQADWTTLLGGEIYTATPSKTGAYVALTSEFDFLRLDAGVRADWFDPGTVRPIVPGRTFTSSAFDPDSSTEALTCTGDAATCDPLAHVWIEGRTYRTLSPSLRVVFPLGSRGSVRLGYGHQVQAPPLSIAIAGANNDVSLVGEDGLFGGDVGPSRTILYEAGARYGFGPGLVIDAAAYYKDLQDQLAYRFRPVYDPVLDSAVDRRIATNADFGDARGVDIALTKRWGDWMAVSAAYSLVSVRSTGSDPLDYVYGLAQLIPPEGVDTVPPLDAPVPTRDGRAHQVSGTVTALVPPDFARGTVLGPVLANLGVFVTFRFGSGLPYTRFENVGSGVRSDWSQLTALRVVDDLQGTTTAWEKYVDLRIAKTFRLGPATFKVYGDFRNVLGLENMPVVFAETGDGTNAAHRDPLVTYELNRMWEDGHYARTTIQKTDADGGNLRTIDALDLRDLSTECPTWGSWAGGPVSCVLLERTERRFGDGDGYFDVEEQEVAVTAWYESLFSAAHFAGRARSVRFGLRVSF